MSFLNKKYTSQHSQSISNSNIKTSIPQYNSAVRQFGPSIGINNCESHPNQLVRHMCLECVQMLCAECIDQHLESHRQSNNIPKILSIKKLRIQMGNKLQQIIHFMTQNNSHNIDIDSILKNSMYKIEQMRQELIRAVDEWVTIMRTHLIQKIGFQQMNKVKAQMQKLYEQIQSLKNALNVNGHHNVIKKIYQIDGDKLQLCYTNMYSKYNQMKNKSQFQFTINWKQIIKNLQCNINLKSQHQMLVDEEPEGEGQGSKAARSERSERNSRQPSMSSKQHHSNNHTKIQQPPQQQ